MFPFVFSKRQPQWKNIKTAKYKAFSMNLFPWCQFYMFILIFSWSHERDFNKSMHTKAPKAAFAAKIPKFLNISNLEYYCVYSHSGLALF